MQTILLTFIITGFLTATKCFVVDIDMDNPATLVDSSFLSVNLGGSLIHHNKFDELTKPRFLALAKGLTGNSLRPEFYLRIGSAKFTFDPEATMYNITMISKLCTFAYELRWKLIFGLNVLLRNEDGTWNPNNSVELIKYVTKQGYYINYELGNEPNLYKRRLNVTLTPEQLAHDFKTLRKILNDITRHQSMLIGPDVTAVRPGSSGGSYFERFLRSLEEGVLDAITFHHYYSGSENITTANFTNVSYLDEFLTIALGVWSMVKKSITSFSPPPLWIGETSNTHSGGSEISESFVAGFLWLDKLGLAAQLNISVVLRQGLRGSHYSLIGGNYDPNPDYWISLLHKQLVGRVVLNVTDFLQYKREVRVYAHCVNRFGGRGYKPNEIVLMILNLNKNKPTKILFRNSALQNLLVDQYLFSPSNGQLDDKIVSLNGNILKMVDETTLPELEPVRIRQPIIVPPLQYGFYVLLGSHADACTK